MMPRHEIDSLVLELLGDHPTPLVEVAAFLHGQPIGLPSTSLRAARQALHRLKRRGWAEVDRYPGWALTCAGEAELQRRREANDDMGSRDVAREEGRLE